MSEIKEIWCYSLAGLKQGWSTSKTYHDDKRFYSEPYVKELIENKTKSLEKDIKNLKYHLSVVMASYEGYIEGIEAVDGKKIIEPTELTDAKLFLETLKKK